METTWLGRARSRFFMPDESEVTFVKRGFSPTDPTRQANLEKVGRIFLNGFEYALAGRSLADIESSLEEIEPTFRGFAYEGGGMGLAVRDALLPAGQHWSRDMLAGKGANHVYMIYIGAGWAMARVPRVRWRSITPRDPLLRWLALDGWGFHQAYFYTSQYVGGQSRSGVPGWRPAPYALRAADQGIGRALWFVNGSDVERVAAAIGKFEPSRHGDLWSGAGLASVYAGGVDAGELADMVRLAGRHRQSAAQGAAFAAKARLLAGLVTPGTELGVKVHCGMTVEEAAAVTDEAAEGLPADSAGNISAYEVWRERIRNRFA
jgi:enediyne biosynthesis protein E3